MIIFLSLFLYYDRTKMSEFIMKSLNTGEWILLGDSSDWPKVMM
jgi:hypothetical protein